MDGRGRQARRRPCDHATNPNRIPTLPTVSFLRKYGTKTPLPRRSTAAAQRCDSGNGRIPPCATDQWRGAFPRLGTPGSLRPDEVKKRINFGRTDEVNRKKAPAFQGGAFLFDAHSVQVVEEMMQLLKNANHPDTSQRLRFIVRILGGFGVQAGMRRVSGDAECSRRGG